MSLQDVANRVYKKYGSDDSMCEFFDILFCFQE